MKVIPIDQGSEDEDGAADADDAQLAWEMMEMARRIWEIDGTEKHLQELAGEDLVHSADTGEVAHPPAVTAVQLQDQRLTETTPHKESPVGAGRCGLSIFTKSAQREADRMNPNCRGGAGSTMMGTCRRPLPELEIVSNGPFSCMDKSVAALACMTRLVLGRSVSCAGRMHAVHGCGSRLVGMFRPPEPVA